jgi:hypothetical protein
LSPSLAFQTPENFSSLDASGSGPALRLRSGL